MSEMRYAVVCVDDDPYILQMLGFQLSKIMDQSHTLIEYFTDPDQAIENIDLLIEEDIDIMFVMVDYQMPSMTGAELIRKLKLKYQDLKCIMLSGQANRTSVDSLKTENLLEEFIEKPWDEDELFDTLRPLIALPK
ncbi:MAG: response regulator [Crocinitomicaceae bacterium]|jgi:DNA-binding NtrC family response regulator|nr:response regulator [Crocinitomicaceae bacterium]MDG1735376.1 response regulator [Crocinitomicaceae bacterium]